MALIGQECKNELLPPDSRDLVHLRLLFYPARACWTWPRQKQKKIKVCITGIEKHCIYSIVLNHSFNIQCMFITKLLNIFYFCLCLLQIAEQQVSEQCCSDLKWTLLCLLLLIRLTQSSASCPKPLWDRGINNERKVFVILGECCLTSCATWKYLCAPWHLL